MNRMNKETKRNIIIAVVVIVLIIAFSIAMYGYSAISLEELVDGRKVERIYCNYTSATGESTIINVREDVQAVYEEMAVLMDDIKKPYVSYFTGNMYRSGDNGHIYINIFGEDKLHLSFSFGEFGEGNVICFYEGNLGSIEIQFEGDDYQKLVDLIKSLA